MAYVAISNQLMDEVRSKINRMKEAELNSLPPSNDNLSFSYVPQDYETLIWGEHLHLRNVIPDTWKRHVGEICGTAQFSHNERTHKANLYIKLGAKVSAPPIPNASSYRADITMPETHPDMAVVIERNKQVLDITDKWSALSSKIRDFLNNCKSLNEAVKLWPDVRIYIPQSYMDRMLAKSERTAEKISKASEFLKQIDTDHAIAAAVSARMAGAKV
jgi:hypothetical protein